MNLAKSAFMPQLSAPPRAYPRGCTTGRWRKCTGVELVRSIRERYTDEMDKSTYFALFDQEPAPPPGAAIMQFSPSALGPEWVFGERWAGGGPSAKSGDLWHFGSVGKAMTSSLIAGLVADGILDWDDRAVTWLPELSDSEYEALTLRMLLGHRSGLPTDPPRASLFRYLLLGGSPESASRRMLARSVRKPPVFPPGSDFLYSNLGYGLVGLAASRVLGIEFATLMHTRLIKPWGLSGVNFGLPPQDGTAPREHMRLLRAKGWKSVKHGRRVVDDLPILQPSGCMHGPVAALATFGQRHLNIAQGSAQGSDDQLAETHQPIGPAPETGKTWRYGMGWFVDNVLGDGRNVLWHAGSTGGCFALLIIVPEAASGLALVANAFDPLWTRPDSPILLNAVRLADKGGR